MTHRVYMIEGHDDLRIETVLAGTGWKVCHEIIGHPVLIPRALFKRLTCSTQMNLWYALGGDDNNFREPCACTSAYSFPFCPECGKGLPE